MPVLLRCCAVFVVPRPTLVSLPFTPSRHSRRPPGYILAARRQASFASTCSTTSFPCKDGSQPLLRDLVVTGDRGRDGRGGSAGPQQRITQRRSSEYLDLIFIEKYCWGYLRIHMPGRALDGHTSPVERGRPSSLQIAFLEWGKLIVCTKN